MNIKRNSSFRLFAYGKDQDKYQIRLRVTFNGQRIDFSTGCQLSSIKVNEKHPTPSEISQKYKKRISGTTPQKPKPEPKMAEAKEKPLGFFEVFDMFMKECGEKNAWTVATSKKMDSLRVDLMAFKKNISFEDLTDSTLAKFVAYLRNEKKLRTPRKKKADRDDEDTDTLIGVKSRNCVNWPE